LYTPDHDHQLTTQSWWWKPWSAILKTAWLPKKPPTGDGRNLGTGNRNRVGAFGCVHPHRIYPGNYRTALPAVRGYHRNFGDPSAFNALTLSPALAALMLRPRKRAAAAEKVFRLVQPGFPKEHGPLHRGLRRPYPQSAVAIAMLVVFAGAAAFFGARLPTKLLPDEDQGYFYINLQLPSASSLQRTEQVAAKVEAILAKTPGVKYTTSVVGFSL